MKVSTLKRLIKEIIKESGFKPLPRDARPYKCTVCGAVQSITTNHDGPVVEYCPKCSHSPSRGQSYDIPGRHKHCRAFVYDPSVNEVNQKDIKSRRPHPFMPLVGMNQNQPDFKKMTLDNLKSIKDKCKRAIEYLKVNKHLRTNVDDLQRELKLWKLCDDEMKKRLQYINKPVSESQGISNNQTYYQTNCTGTSHGVSADPRSVPSVRDELNDPIMNGKLHEHGEKTEHFHVEWNSPDISKGAGKIFLGNKWFANAMQSNEDWNPKHIGKWLINRHTEAFNLKFPSLEMYFDDVQTLLDYLENWYESRKINEQYKFDDFKYLARGDGFGIPSDVYYGTILIGVIVSQENGYVIGLVKGPTGDRSYKQDPKRPFKTKDDAAEALHRAWKSIRHGEETKSF